LIVKPISSLRTTDIDTLPTIDNPLYLSCLLCHRLERLRAFSFGKSL
jgi:hypothetical protein